MPLNLTDKFAQNNVNITGTLVKTSFTEKPSPKSGVVYRNCKATIRVTQTYNDGQTTETSDIPVSFIASEFYGNGKPNPLWGKLAELREMKTMTTDGPDEAARISLYQGSIQENAFVGRSGKITDAWQVRGRSFDTAYADAKNMATFAIEIFIIGITEETNANDETTGRWIIKGATVDYGQKISVLQFYIENPETINYITSNWNADETVMIKGRIRCAAERVVSETEGGFGEDIPNEFVRTTYELVATTGSPMAYPEEKEFAMEDIQRLMMKRKAERQQLLADATRPVTTTTAPRKAGWE